MASLSLERIVKRYGEVSVIHFVDLDVRDGEFMVFVGPSGCGKSTLLRMIAGLESVTEGDLRIDGVRANDVPAAQRHRPVSVVCEPLRRTLGRLINCRRDVGASGGENPFITRSVGSEL